MARKHKRAIQLPPAPLAAATAQKSTGSASAVFGRLSQKAGIYATLELAKFRTATTTARKPPADGPRRKPLIELYEGVVMDNHVQALMNTRTVRLMANRFQVQDAKSGKVDEEWTRRFRQPWFYEVLEHLMDSLYYGHTLLELGPENENGQPASVELIPRKNVVPETGEVLLDDSDQTGLGFRDGGPLAGQLLEFGWKNDLGVLHQITPMAIYKRNVMRAWAEHAEIYGMPLLSAEMDSYSEAENKKVDDFLANAGSKRYVRVPRDTKFTVHESSAGKHGIYLDMIELVNKEMSKVFVGGTMLNEDGSSRSQSEVHERLADDFLLADLRWAEGEITWRLIPFLVNLYGWALTGKEFVWLEETTLKPSVQWQVDSGLLDRGYDIAPEYFFNRYGVEVGERKAKPEPAPAPKQEPEPA